MSVVRGSGWGDCHNWEKPDELQFGRNHIGGPTVFQCQECGIVFHHAYNYISDIFDAMKDAQVPNDCIKREWIFRGSDCA